MKMYAFLDGSQTDANTTKNPPHPNDSTNSHIFEALYNDANKSWYIPQDAISCCSSRIAKNGAWVDKVFDENQLRIEAAVRQNSHKNICANCVRTFY